jgi:serine/threonine protein kinase
MNRKFIKRQDEFEYNPDDYNLVKKLGAGAFGETFIAQDKKSGNQLVVKKLPKESNVEIIVEEKDENGDIVERKSMQTTGTSKKMFDEEVQVLKHMKPLCKPNVLCYVGVSSKNNDPTIPYRFIATEYLDHYIMLDDYIKNTPDDIRWANVRPLFTNLINGLNDLHRANVAHRDIKPTNLMINPGGAPPLPPLFEKRMMMDDKRMMMDDKRMMWDKKQAQPREEKKRANVDDNKYGMHIKYIDLGLSCIKEQCTDYAGTPLYLLPEIKFPRSGATVAEAQANKSTLPLDFETYKIADYWALAITMIEYILGEDLFSHLIEVDIKPKDMINYLPKEFVLRYPDIVSSLAKMVSAIPSSRKLPSVRFS